MKSLIYNTLMLILAIIAIATTYYIPELLAFSGFAAAIAYAVLGIGFWCLFDKYVLKDLDTISELKQGNTAVALTLIAVAILLHAAVCKANINQDQPLIGIAHVDTMLSYVGETEQTPNSSPLIDKMLALVHLKPHNPYCAAAVSFCLDVSNVSTPKTRSALAAAFINKTSIPASKYLNGTYKPKPGDIVVWRRGNTIFGHIGFIVKTLGNGLLCTVEANTSSDNVSSQYEGQGIFVKTRRVYPTNHFRITHFTPVRYEKV